MYGAWFVLVVSSCQRCYLWAWSVVRIAMLRKVLPLQCPGRPWWVIRLGSNGAVVTAMATLVILRDEMASCEEESCIPTGTVCSLFGQTRNGAS